MRSNETTHAPPPLTFPAAEGVELKCALVLVFASLSLVSAVVVTTLYVRLREALRRPILDCLVYSIVLAIPGSVNLIVSAALRLGSPSLHGYCSLSGFFFQQFTLTEIMAEGCFFGAIGWTLSGGTVTYVGVRRLFAAFLLIGAIAGTVPLAALPQDSSTNSAFGSALPWCWLPTYDGWDADGKPSMSSKLIAFKFVFGYMWAILAMLCSVATGITLLRRYRNSVTRVHPAIKWRLLYCAFFSFCWLVCLVPRVFADSLSDAQQTDMQYVLAVVAPGMPFFNCVLFVTLEGVLEVVGGGDSSRCAACYDAMRMVDSEDSVVVIYNDRDDIAESLVTAEGHRAQSTASSAAAAAGIGTINDRSKNSNSQSHSHSSSMTPRAGGTFAAIEEIQAAAAERESRDVQRIAKLPKPPIGVAMSFVGGYADACGFVTMDLFTAHVTGNIVLIGVHVANKHKVETAEIWPKLAAIPVFAFTIAVVYSMGSVVKHWHRRFLLAAQCTLFLASFLAAYFTGPFTTDKHSGGAWAAGMTMVAGMAVQNSYQRYHLVGLPMTTFMTGNTNQIVHDLVEMFRKWRAGEPSSAFTPLYKRTTNNVLSWLAFFSGCMMASLLYRFWGMWCFLPPCLCVAAIIVYFWDETAMPPAPKKA